MVALAQITRHESCDSYSAAIARYLLHPSAADSGPAFKEGRDVQWRSRPATVISREPVWHNKGIRKPDGEVVDAALLRYSSVHALARGNRAAGWLDQRPAHTAVTRVTTIQRRSTLSPSYTQGAFFVSRLHTCVSSFPTYLKNF